MKRTRHSITALAFLAVLALAGCGVPGGGTPGGDGAAGCLVGKTWVRDLPDSAQQLGAQLTSNGLNVIDATGEGRETFVFNADGSAVLSADITYTISVAMDSGMTLTLVQTHAGEPSGGWTLDAGTSTITFSDWQNNGYAILNTVLVNGVGSDIPMDFPAENLGESAMSTQCSGNSLATQSEGSPFTAHWTAGG